MTLNNLASVAIANQRSSTSSQLISRLARVAEMVRVGLEGGWVGKGGFGVHHRAVAKLPEHCANFVVGWLVGGGAPAAAAAADAMRVCTLIRDQQERTITVGHVDSP